MAYIGRKWSERAQNAYDRGEKPISRWTKDDILYEYPEEWEDIETFRD